jgi:hypothetical protein
MSFQLTTHNYVYLDVNELAYFLIIHIHMLWLVGVQIWIFMLIIFGSEIIVVGYAYANYICRIKV